jgi:hypothetical protein
MDVISNDVWQRRGSSVIFDNDSLRPFIAKGAFVSLRTALSWYADIPSAPPVAGPTVLISGLRTIFETMRPSGAENFLRTRVRPLIIELQNRWTSCGLVFEFNADPKSFRVTGFDEMVLYRLNNGVEADLSFGLWRGSASDSVKKLVREGDRPGAGVHIGYYVTRVS